MGKLTSKGGLVPVGKGWLLPVKIEDIQMLIQAVQDSDLVELIWEENGSRLVLKKAAPVQGAAFPAAGVETAQLNAKDTDKGQEVAHRAMGALSPSKHRWWALSIGPLHPMPNHMWR